MAAPCVAGRSSTMANRNQMQATALGIVPGWLCSPENPHRISHNRTPISPGKSLLHAALLLRVLSRFFCPVMNIIVTPLIPPFRSDGFRSEALATVPLRPPARPFVLAPSLVAGRRMNGLSGVVSTVFMLFQKLLAQPEIKASTILPVISGA